MDRKPLTPADVRDVVFDKAPRGKRGYNEKQVDDFLDLVEATLAGTKSLTAEEVSAVVFEDAPLIKRGYHEDQVDGFLDLVVDTLERLERAGAERVAAAQRAAPPHPIAVEETVPMAFAQPPSLPPELTEPLEPDDPSETGLLALPLPPAPPGERGYRPGDVEKLARLLIAAAEQVDGPTSADVRTARLHRTFFNGQGYRTDVVDTVISAWVEELRNREG
jgi:DivIVA domain-containing protein